MYETRTVMEPVSRKCHVQYYVEADPNLDAHWKYEEPFVLDDRYFETRAEAERYIEQADRRMPLILTVREKVTPI